MNRASSLARYVKDLFEECFIYSAKIKKDNSTWDMASLKQQLSAAMDPDNFENLKNISQVVRNRISLFRDVKLPKLELVNTCVRKLVLDCNNSSLNIMPFIGFLEEFEPVRYADVPSLGQHNGFRAKAVGEVKPQT